MKNIVPMITTLVLAILVAATPAAHAQCPATVTCNTGGGGMTCSAGPAPLSLPACSVCARSFVKGAAMGMNVSNCTDAGSPYMFDLMAMHASGSPSSATCMVGWSGVCGTSFTFTSFNCVGDAGPATNSCTISMADGLPVELMDFEIVGTDEGGEEESIAKGSEEPH